MQEMHSIPRTRKQHCGMLEFCGHNVQGFFSLPIEDIHGALIVQGTSEFLFSRGVTQGDPLSMLFCAVAVLPLIQSLKKPSSWTQIWYADNSSCVAALPALWKWFDTLKILGPD